MRRLSVDLLYRVTAGEDPMAEMLARIKSGNVHLRRIEAATSVSQHLLHNEYLSLLAF